MEAARRQSEYFDARFGHADRVFELRRHRAVAGDRGPAVGQDLHMRPAEIDHRLDREEHAGLQHDALAAPAIMEDVGLVVEQAAEAMAAEIADHGTTLRFGKFLDRRADVAGGGAGPHDGNAAHHRLVGHVDEALGPAGNLADEIHAARIAVPTIDDEGHVDIHDVGFLERPASGMPWQTT